MTGLADAYHDDVGALQSPLRLKAGAALLAAGTVLGLAALVAVLLAPADYGARRIAGVLGGLAAPALVGGVVVILPANPRLRAAAAIGASITLLGVASFWHAYPEHWAGYGRNLTGYVTAVYFLGMLTLVCCCFAGIATLKRRNDPGGTVSLQVGEGETKVVTVRERVSGGLGGVGLLGGTPDGDVETQTNRPDRGRSSGSGGKESRSRSGRSGSSVASDASSTGTYGSSAGPTGSSASSVGGSSGAGGSSAGPTASSSGSTGLDSGTSGFGAESDGWGSGASVSSGNSTRSSSLDAMSRSTSSGSSGASSGTSGGSTGFSSGRLDSSGGATGDGGPSATSSSREPRDAVSDGGATTDAVRDVEPSADAGPAGSGGEQPNLADRYCGNCEHFQYARTERGMTPYCALKSEYMEDVEACEDWSSNA